MKRRPKPGRFGTPGGACWLVIESGWCEEPGSRSDAGSGDGSALPGAGAGGTVPPVLGGVNGAHTDVVDADGAGKVVEVDIELTGRRLEGDGHRFVVDVVL